MEKILLTNREEIEKIVFGKVMRMHSFGHETIEYMDEEDAFDIAYDATVTGGVYVYLETDGKLFVRYVLAPCTLTEIEASTALTEWVQLKALCRREPSIYMKDSAYYEPKNQYGITLEHPVLEWEAYSFDGQYYWRSTQDGVTAIPDFDTLLTYVNAYIQRAQSTM